MAEIETFTGSARTGAATSGAARQAAHASHRAGAPLPSPDRPLEWDRIATPPVVALRNHQGVARSQQKVVVEVAARDDAAGAHLDALLADQPLAGGLEPRLGDAHLRILTIVGFPAATTPGILEELNRLAFPYRWSTRAILLDKTDAAKLLTRIRRQWFAKRKSVAAILKEVMTNEASALVDTDAANKAADADLALQELGADYAGEAYVTATLTVWDADPRIADEKLRLVEKISTRVANESAKAYA